MVLELSQHGVHVAGGDDHVPQGLQLLLALRGGEQADGGLLLLPVLGPQGLAGEGRMEQLMSPKARASGTSLSSSSPVKLEDLSGLHREYRMSTGPVHSLQFYVQNFK